MRRGFGCIELVINLTGGNRNAVLVGDPEKPGLYIVINKWLDTLASKKI